MKYLAYCITILFLLFGCSVSNNTSLVPDTSCNLPEVDIDGECCIDADSDRVCDIKKADESITDSSNISAMAGSKNDSYNNLTEEDVNEFMDRFQSFFDYYEITASDYSDTLANVKTKFYHGTDLHEIYDMLDHNIFTDAKSTFYYKVVYARSINDEYPYYISSYNIVDIEKDEATIELVFPREFKEANKNSRMKVAREDGVLKIIEYNFFMPTDDEVCKTIYGTKISDDCYFFMAYTAKNTDWCKKLSKKSLYKDGCDSLDRINYTNAIRNFYELEIGGDKDMSGGLNDAVLLFREYWQNGDYDLIYDDLIKSPETSGYSREDFNKFMSVLGKYYTIDVLDYGEEYYKNDGDILSPMEPFEMFGVDIHTEESYKKWNFNFAYNKTMRNWQVMHESLFLYKNKENYCTDFAETTRVDECRKEMAKLK